MEMFEKPHILIVDDSALNRELLSDILSDSYEIEEASDGSQALEIISVRRDDFACVLLDLSMSNVNGFEVLEKMQKKGWIRLLPVIIISAENTSEYIRKSFELGASDYISRPFDSVVVQRRIDNTVQLYAKQKRLARIIIEQMNENERLNDMMVSILGHTVEFRNKESNTHIKNVSIFTKVLLEQLNQYSDKYRFSKKQIQLIVRASALHDIGKVSIADDIINKPGKLSTQEYLMMKEHTLIGDKMLESISEYKEEPLVQYARKISRWHHERYDGKGYPDGLKGSEIPIEAQVVSLSDVYDALTSERCYKKAFTHDKAIEMIINGECGKFNPDLIECLKNVEADFQQILKNQNYTKLKNYKLERAN